MPSIVMKVTTSDVKTNNVYTGWSVSVSGTLTSLNTDNLPPGAVISATATWSFGSVSGNQQNATVSSNVVTNTKTFTYQNLPNDVTDTGTVVLNVYETHENHTTLYVTGTASFTLNVHSSAKPNIQNALVIEQVNSGNTSGWNAYIQNVSRAKISYSGLVAGTGATLVSRTITSNPSYISITAQASTSSGNVTSNVLGSSGTITFTVTVKDSRGRTFSKSASITVQSYSPPRLTAEPTVYRCSYVDGNYIRDDTGGTIPAFIVSFAKSSIKNSSNVELNTWSVRRLVINSVTKNDLESGVRWVAGTALSVNSNYTAVLTLTDAVGKTLTYNIVVPSAAYILHVRKNGMSMGIGGAAGTSDDYTVHFGWKANFKNGIKVGEYDAAKLDYAFYSKVNELGQVAGSAKIVDVWDEMSTPSMLVTPISQFASTESPASGVSGMVVVSKSQFQGMGYVHFYGKTTADGEYYMTIAASSYNAQNNNKPSGVWHSAIVDTGGDMVGDLVFKNGNGKGVRINTANDTNYVKLSASGQVVQLITDATQSGNPTSIFSFDLANRTLKNYWKPWGVDSGGTGGTTLNEAKENLGLQASGQAVNIIQPTGSGQLFAICANVNNSSSGFDGNRIMILVDEPGIGLYNIATSSYIWRCNLVSNLALDNLSVPSSSLSGISSATPTGVKNDLGTAMIRVSFSLDGSLSNGSTASFKISGLPTPELETTGAAYYQSHICATRLQTDGTVLVRNTSGSSISSGTSMSTSFTYMYRK